MISSDLICEPINFALTIFDKNEGYFREKEMFQWTSKSYCVIEVCFH